MVHLQFYPFKKHRIYLKSAIGVSDYTNLRPDGYHGTGNAFMEAIGFERGLGKGKFISGIQLSYNTGKLKYNYIPGTSKLIDRKFQSTDLTIFLAID